MHLSFIDPFDYFGTIISQIISIVLKLDLKLATEVIKSTWTCLLRPKPNMCLLIIFQTLWLFWTLMIGPYWSLEISLKHLECIGFTFNTKKNHLSFIYSVWEKMMSFDQVLSEIMIIRRWSGEQIDRTLKNKCVYNSLLTTLRHT